MTDKIELSEIVKNVEIELTDSRKKEIAEKVSWLYQKRSWAEKRKKEAENTITKCSNQIRAYEEKIEKISAGDWGILGSINPKEKIGEDVNENN